MSLLLIGAQRHEGLTTGCVETPSAYRNPWLLLELSKWRFMSECMGCQIGVGGRCFLPPALPYKPCRVGYRHQPRDQSVNRTMASDVSPFRSTDICTREAGSSSEHHVQLRPGVVERPFSILRSVVSFHKDMPYGLPVVLVVVVR